MSRVAPPVSRRTDRLEAFTMIRIVTVEREFGSGGGVIAAKLAKRLGWTLWDQSLTDEIARRMDCDSREVAERQERPDPAYYRLFKAFLRGSYEGSVNLPRLRLVDADCVRETTRQILLEIGDAGSAVVVGRGSAYYLANREDVFHVFVYGSARDKVRRLKSTGWSENEALESAETVDRDRRAFIKRYFDIEWPSRHMFHLMVNSGIGDDVAVETILDAAIGLAEPRT
jgi:cytidylate kinase